MKDTYVDGKKLARNGQKTATYYAASFLSHYRRVLFSHLLVFNLSVYVQEKLNRFEQEFRREGWTEKRLAVHFCLDNGLFGSYNSD